MQLQLLQISNGTQPIAQQTASTFDWTFALVLSTIALVVVTGYFLAQSNKRTRESNRLTMTRLRPLLAFVSIKASLQTSGDRREVRVFGTLKNSGTVTARNIIGHYKETASTYLRQLVAERKEMQSVLEVDTLRPDDQYEFSIHIPWAVDKQFSKLVIWFEYDHFEQKDELVTLIDVTASGSDRLSHKWFEHEDIRKASEPLKGI